MSLNREPRRLIRRLFHICFARYWPWKTRLCVVCGKASADFIPYRYGESPTPALLATLRMVGSDMNNFSCAWCGSHDRERHLVLYLRSAGIFEWIRGRRILHFAPERHLPRLINAAQPTVYVLADLHAKEPNVECVDIMQMPYPDASFDLVIANHVLEHVHNDMRALSEIRRVLGVNGQAILQTPYSSRLHHTWSDPGIDAEDARRQAYGQEDHVRLYGEDIFERFKSAGLISQVRTHDNLLPTIDAKKHGVNSLEPLFLFSSQKIIETPYC